MVASFIKAAWRALLRKKVLTAIHVVGLALGLSACIVIYLITRYEFEFDAFHPDVERIYRVMGDVTESTGDVLHFARLPLPVARFARAEVSGLDEIAAVVPYNTPIRIPDGDRPEAAFESRTDGSFFTSTALTEAAYFEIFPYEWLAGDPATALEAPNSVVLTASRARRYFGSEPPAGLLGRHVLYGDSLLAVVSGVVKDRDRNTDLTFTDFISFSTLQGRVLNDGLGRASWLEHDMVSWVFAKLSDGTPPGQVNEQLNGVVLRHAGSQIRLSLWLEPLSDVHFNADVIENPIRTGHLPTLYGLMGIAVCILGLAVLNFINLATAQHIQRTKEIGIRRVLGSGQGRLVTQFMVETLVVTLLSVWVAVGLVDPLLWLFRSFIPEGVAFHLIDGPTLLFLGLMIVVTVVGAGLYPALAASATSSATSGLSALGLRGPVGGGGRDTRWLRRGLVVFQFTVSLVFIIGSLVMANQLRYTREKDLGFAADGIITVEAPRGDSLAKIQVAAQEIARIPGVEEVALQWLSPMTENSRGMRLKFEQTDEKDFWVTQVVGNEGFIPLYGIEILAGRNVAPAERVEEFVINERLVQMMGLATPEEALGEVLYWNDEPYPVVGVVKDFHTSSLHRSISPLCIINRPDREGALSIRLKTAGTTPGGEATTLARIKATWEQIYPAGTFAYRSYAASLALLYEKDRQASTLVNASMAVAVFISCLGLFGLTLFSIERRSKEIGIRKILGASIAHIVTLLSRDIVALSMTALVLATPVAWFLMDRWLQRFAYSTGIPWWTIVLAGLTTIGIALGVVGVQALRAALAHPVEALRSE